MLSMFTSAVFAGSLFLRGALASSPGSSFQLSAYPALQCPSNAKDPPQPGKRPNFVFIMTDDQDLHMNSLDYQPTIRKYFSSQGVTYKNHFVTLSICCPSRVSLWTGMVGHNTNVTDVNPPFGKLTSPCWNVTDLRYRWLSEVHRARVQ